MSAKEDIRTSSLPVDLTLCTSARDWPLAADWANEPQTWRWKSWPAAAAVRTTDGRINSHKISSFFFFFLLFMQDFIHSAFLPALWISRPLCGTGGIHNDSVLNVPLSAWFPKGAVSLPQFSLNTEAPVHTRTRAHTSHHPLKTDAPNICLNVFVLFFLADGKKKYTF